MTTSDFTNENSVPPATLPDPELEPLDSFRPFDSFAFQAALLGALIERRLTATLSPFGLTPSEFRILVALEKIGPSTAAELTKLTPIDSSFVSRTVQRLAEKGMLARRRSRNDRRTILLRPTREAEMVLVKIRQPLKELDTEIVGDIESRELDCAKAAILKTLTKTLNFNDS